MANKGSNSAKNWLIRIFSVSVALCVIRLFGAASIGSGFGLAVICLVMEGIMLTAIIKRWRIVLIIGRIVLMFSIVAGVIGIVVGGILLGADDEFIKSQRNFLIFCEVGFSIGLLFNVILFKLLGKYTDELASLPYATMVQ